MTTTTIIELRPGYNAARATSKEVELAIVLVTVLN
jgi:hypothetical protein